MTIGRHFGIRHPTFGSYNSFGRLARTFEVEQFGWAKNALVTCQSYTVVQPCIVFIAANMKDKEEKALQPNLLQSLRDADESSFGSDDDDSDNDDAESHTNRSTRTLSNIREDIKVSIRY
jgi:hypothetical protein